MKMAWFNLLLMLFAFSIAATGADWEKRESGSLAWLHAVQFLDANAGFAAGSNGTLLVTSDAGKSWKKLAVPVTDTIRDVHFTDRSHGWMLCDRGGFRSGRNASYLLRTQDAGATWSPVEFGDSSERFSRLFFSAGGTGFLVGEGGLLSRLAVGDKAETKSVLPVRFLMMDGAVPDDSRIVLIGGGGSLISSVDNGRSWQSARFNGTRPESKLNAVYFVDGQNGWVSGNGGIVLSTEDGGRSWSSRTAGTDADLFDIAFFDLRTGFAVGENGTAVRTADSGTSWTLEKSGSKHRLERLAFTGKRVIAVGFGGTILSRDLP